MIGDNHQGGMTFTKFFPSDWRTGCLVLNLEEEGLYIRVCMFHYDTGRALPDNDAAASQLLNVQIHKYRKVMASLVAKGKIIRAQGVIFNERVQEEIDKYRMEHVARSTAAKKREAERKAAQLERAVTDEIERRRQTATPGVTPHPTPTLTPPVRQGATPPVASGQPTQLGNGKTNETGHSQSTAVPQADQPRGTNLEARNQKPEEEKLATLSAEPHGLAGLNGSAEPMIVDIINWMTGGDRQSAKNWLSTFLNQYAQDVVRESYFTLKTDIAEGKLISQPLRVWSKIAARLKSEPRQRGVSGDGAAKESRSERIKRFVDEASEKLTSERRRT